jgi:hypothetical protein
MATRNFFIKDSISDFIYSWLYPAFSSYFKTVVKSLLSEVSSGEKISWVSD